jgi:hypothetical protein
MQAAKPRAACVRCARGAPATRCAAGAPHGGTQPHAAATPSRRALLRSSAAAAAAAAAALGARPGPALAEAAAAAAAEAASPLEPLFSASELYYPGPSLSYLKQLYYPSWLFGEWRVTSRLAAFATPRGARFVPPRAAQAASDDLGRETAFAARFYSTLPDTRENAVRVALGLLPRDAVLADRAFNAASLADATLAASAPPGAPPAVRSAVYDPRDAPDALTLVYSDNARAELFLSALRSDPVLADDDAGAGAGAAPAAGPRVFRTAECSRQTTVSVRSVDVRDFQILSRFEELAPGRVRVRQRVGVYLTPQARPARAPRPAQRAARARGTPALTRHARAHGCHVIQAPLYFEALNVAVALYDYDMEMERVGTQQAGGGPELACVLTPKDVTQCQ